MILVTFHAPGSEFAFPIRYWSESRSRTAKSMRVRIHNTVFFFFFIAHDTSTYIDFESFCRPWDDLWSSLWRRAGTRACPPQSPPGPRGAAPKPSVPPSSCSWSGADPGGRGREVVTTWTSFLYNLVADPHHCNADPVNYRLNMDKIRIRDKHPGSVRNTVGHESTVPVPSDVHGPHVCGIAKLPKIFYWHVS